MSPSERAPPGGGRSDRDRRAAARELMLEFADATGVSSERAPRRYLWTDAFAVCTCLALHGDEAAGAGPADAAAAEAPPGDGSALDETWLDRALRLVDQVHHVLGRHRDDDPRSGWISGLDEEEGERHPTAGGLRIGKRLPERGPHEPADRRLEWDRDGQYYHYLTRWMHALARVARATGRPVFLRWARELAAVAHDRFTAVDGADGPLRLYWKMSIDLSRPLVGTMGAHDPLDGWVTFRALQRARPSPATRAWSGEVVPGTPPPGAADGAGPDLAHALLELAQICEGRSWATDDALGIGGLLTNVHRLATLAVAGDADAMAWALDLVDDAVRSLEVFRSSDPLVWPAEHRLPFRELGLAIGLRGMEDLLSGAAAKGGGARASMEDAAAERVAELGAGLRALEPFLPLADAVEEFWLDPGHRTASTWTDHRDINTVMLATSLAPGGYLGPT